MVNSEIWVERQLLEHDLLKGLEGSLTVAIHGESGSGKTWLWKRVAEHLDAECCHANFANAARFDSITEELRNLVERDERATKASYSTSKGIEGGVWAWLKAKCLHTWDYRIGRKEPFEECLKQLRRKAGDRPALLVIENLEVVAQSSPSLLRELSNLLLLCDDQRYASYNVKIVLVGAVGGLRRCFSEMPNSNSVMSRIYEVSEVGRLAWPAAERLLRKGLRDLLGYEIECEQEEGENEKEDDIPRDTLDSDRNDGPNPNVAPTEEEQIWGQIAEHALWVTDRMPHDLHAYALEVAGLAEESDGMLSLDQLEVADQAWAAAGLKPACEVVSDYLGGRSDQIGRRNQVLWILGQIDERIFSAERVNIEMRSRLRVSTRGVKSGFDRILTQLAAGPKPLIERVGGSDSYRFVNSRYRMSIRVLLALGEDERVEPRFDVVW